MNVLRDIDENNIDVEAIMRKVKEKMDNKIQIQHLPIDRVDSNSRPDQLRSDIEYLSTISSIYNSQYTISSHRRLIGPVLVKGRQLVNGEVRRYVDPIICQQSEFNINLVRVIEVLLKEMNERFQVMDSRINSIRYDIDNTKLEMDNFRSGTIEHIEKKVDFMVDNILKEMNERFQVMDSRINSIRYDIDNTKLEMDNFRSGTIEHIEKKVDFMVDNKLKEVSSFIDADLNNKAWLANVLEKRIKDNAINMGTSLGERSDINMNYIAFEEKFRGAIQNIKQRQSFFVEYFRQCKNVLDIGCGRGEFLELMKESGIPARGVDIDDDMVNYCIRHGLNVRKEDALAFLEKEENDSIDGIFMDQVIEHLEPAYLIKLLVLCHKKLMPGGIILMETVNPMSLTSFANFYIDMTHVKPVHPYTLRYLAESAGFKDIEVKFIAPVPDEFRLKKIDISPECGESDRRAFMTYNSNIDRLNDLLFGPQDYALIGRK